MTDRNLIGQKIAELRKNKGMTQAELADLLGVSHQAVSQWERSETLPDILTLPLIAEIFGESIGAILGVEEVKKDEPPKEAIPVDIDRLIDEGEKKKPKVTANNFGGEILINGRKVSDNSGCQLDTDGFSLPVSEETIDLSRDSDYEVAVIKDGKIIKKFSGNPDPYLKITLVGECRDLRSEMSVDVSGNVNGKASSGYGMNIGGDVHGNATSGFEMRCGNVGGNASAGFDLHCGSIGGTASGGFGITKNKDNSAENIGMDPDDISLDGKNLTINGDYSGDIAAAASITVMGDVHGKVISEGCVTVHGDVEGDASAGDSLTVDGDIGGSSSAGDSVNVGGDVGSSVSAGDNVCVEGDINGDVSCGGEIKVEGDLNGDIISAGGDIHISGDDEETIQNMAVRTDGQNIEIDGDYSGNITTAANITIRGNVDGDVSCNNLTVEGDVQGDIDAGGSVTVGDDVQGDVDAGGSVTVGGDVNGDVDAGGAVSSGGDISGDVDAGGNVTAGGDIDGDVDAGNNVTAEGDVNGDITTSGDVRIEGDANGNIRGKSITVEGDYNG